MKSRPTVVPCSVPEDGVIAALIPGASFRDAYVVAVDHPDRTALEHVLTALKAAPPWAEVLMGIRNRLVALFGLKNLGALGLSAPNEAPRAFEIGDRIGIFTLISQTDDEVLLGDDDKHLRVVLSLRRLASGSGLPARVVMTTVVHTHNLLGRLYMIPVGPMHKLIAPAVMRGVNR